MWTRPQILAIGIRTNTIGRKHDEASSFGTSDHQAQMFTCRRLSHVPSQRLSTLPRRLDLSMLSKGCQKAFISIVSLHNRAFKSSAGSQLSYLHRDGMRRKLTPQEAALGLSALFCSILRLLTFQSLHGLE